LVTGDSSRVGAALLRVAKAPDPDACKRDDTPEQRGHHRRELARYLVSLLQLLIDEQNGKFGIPDLSHPLIF
jgi:hypothetical protein